MSFSSTSNPNDLFRRWLLLTFVAAVLGLLPGHAFAQTNATLTSYIHTDILPWHLSTNTAAHARGLAGSSDDMLALAAWHYGDYSGTNLSLLTNAKWSKSFWLYGVHGMSATCIGYSNGVGGQGLVTMVSPRHYLFSTHMHPEGYLMAFLDTNNVLYWRTTLQRVDVGTDTSVGLLNADLPPSVGFLPVLPSDGAHYLPTNSTFVQGIGMNQNWRVFSQPMAFVYPGYVVWNSHGAAPFGVNTNWNITIRAGDSSDPEMLLINDQLVLVSHTTSVEGGPAYTSQSAEINRQMHALSVNNHLKTDYQLTPIPLDKWTHIN